MARHRIATWGLLLGIAATASVVSAHFSHPSAHTFEFRYTATVTGIPANARHVRLWVPLAKTRGNQRVFERRIQMSYPYEIHEEPVFGNDLLYLTVHSPLPPRIDLAVDYRASVQQRQPLNRRTLFGATEASAEDLALALRDEPLMVVDDTIRALATHATSGQTTALGRAEAIYDYVVGHMRYDKTTAGWGRGDTLRACRLGKGNCTDFHALFISMVRAVDIPARFVIGATIPQAGTGDIPGYHCWAEFYSADYGWVPVDASEAWKHPELRDYYFGTRDPNKFCISVGRNLQLVPAQAGPPVSIFLTPYVEVDEVPYGAVETEFWFNNLTGKGVRT